MITKADQYNLDRIIGRHGLRATLEAIQLSYQLHIKYAGDEDRAAELKAEGNLVSEMLKMVQS